MKKRMLIITIILVFGAITYFAGQYYWLEKTDKLPFRNLTHIGSGSCYVIFNVENRDSIYTVVMPNLDASELVREKYNLRYFFYSLYMREIIAHDFSIGVNDSLFSTINHYVVDPEAIAKFQKVDIRNEKMLFGVGNALSYDIKQSDFNAIVYLFIKGGSNCCLEDYSGVTTVSTKNFPK